MIVPFSGRAAASVSDQTLKGKHHLPDIVTDAWSSTRLVCLMEESDQTRVIVWTRLQRSVVQGLTPSKHISQTQHTSVIFVAIEMLKLNAKIFRAIKIVKICVTSLRQLAI